MGMAAHHRPPFPGLIMRIALLAGALAVTLAASGAARADSSILTYHGSLDRAGHYVMPDLTYERARGVRLDPSVNATLSREVHAQPPLWREAQNRARGLVGATEQEEVYALH